MVTRKASKRQKKLKSVSSQSTTSAKTTQFCLGEEKMLGSVRSRRFGSKKQKTVIQNLKKTRKPRSAGANNIRTDNKAKKARNLDVEVIALDLNTKAVTQRIASKQSEFSCNLFCHIDYLTFKGQLRNLSIFMKGLEACLGRSFGQPYLTLNENESRIMSRGRLEKLFQIFKIDQTVNLEVGKINQLKEIQEKCYDAKDLNYTKINIMQEIKYRGQQKRGRNLETATELIDAYEVYLNMTGQILSQLTFQQQIELIKFLTNCKEYKCTRIDIATDIVQRLVPFEKMLNGTRNNKFTGFRSCKLYESIKAKKNVERGRTIQLGTNNSNKMIRVYETATKHPELPDLIRFEVVLRNVEAQTFFDYLLTINPIDEGQLLQAYKTCIKKSIEPINFVAKSIENEPLYTLPWWDSFKHSVLGSLELIELPIVPKRDKVTVDKNVEWLERQAFPSLSAVLMMFISQTDLFEAHQLFTTWLITNLERVLEKKRLGYEQGVRIKNYIEYAETLFENPSTGSVYTGLDKFLDVGWDEINNQLRMILYNRKKQQNID